MAPPMAITAVKSREMRSIISLQLLRGQNTAAGSRPRAIWFRSYAEREGGPRFCQARTNAMSLRISHCSAMTARLVTRVFKPVEGGATFTPKWAGEAAPGVKSGHVANA